MIIKIYDFNNARIHHATKSLTTKGLDTIKDTAKNININMLYIPPYTPQLNPVELCFNSIKNNVNRQRPITYKDLYDSINDSIKKLNQVICNLIINKILNFEF